MIAAAVATNSVQHPRGLYFDRFDVCEAYYMFAAEWHGGQNSPEYAIFGRLCAIQFRERPGITVESLSENASLIYNSLVRDHQPATGVQHTSALCIDYREPELVVTQDNDTPHRRYSPEDVTCAVCRSEVNS